MKKTTLFSLSSLIAMSLSLQGCNDTQQAVAAGAIIGAAIGVAASEDNSSHRHGDRYRDRYRETCHGEYRQECTSYRDYWGNYVRQCREVYDRCARYYETELNPNATAEQIAANKFVSEEDARIAQEWALGFDGAETLSTTVKQLNQGDISAVSAWGLSSWDLMDWSKGRELSKSTVDKIASKLNIPVEQADVMVRTVSEKVRAQMPVKAWDGY